MEQKIVIDGCQYEYTSLSVEYEDGRYDGWFPALTSSRVKLSVTLLGKPFRDFPSEPFNLELFHPQSNFIFELMLYTFSSEYVEDDDHDEGGYYITEVEAYGLDVTKDFQHPNFRCELVPVSGPDKSERYPNICPSCGGPSYNGLTRVDCLNDCGAK